MKIMKWRSSVLSLSVFVLVVSLALPGWTQAKEPFYVKNLSHLDMSDPESLREVYLRFMDVLANRGQGQGSKAAVRAYRRFEELSYLELAAMLEAMPADNVDDFRDSVQRLTEIASTVPAARPVPKGILGLPLGSTAIIGPYPISSFYDFSVIGPLSFPAALPDTGGADPTNNIPGLNDERCEVDFYGGLLLAVDVLQLISIPLEAACNADPTGLSCVGYVVDAVATWAATFELERCDFHIGNVDSAEIEATYENVLQIYDALKCTVVAAPRKIHGCNGEDDNCNRSIDECAEDTFGPDLFIDPSVSSGWFNSSTDAAAAVAAAVQASDDCQSISVDAPVLAGSCASSSASVTATDSCGNSTTVSSGLMIDENPPEVSCTVQVDSISPANHEMVSVGFSFEATDDCVDPPTVVVTVTSDESSTSTNGQGQTSFSPDAELLTDLDGVVMEVDVRAERASPGDGRVYEIGVTATDLAGNSGRATCQVSVPRNNNGTAIDSGQFYNAIPAN